jgi:hypothetical protein
MYIVETKQLHQSDISLHILFQNICGERLLGKDKNDSRIHLTVLRRQFPITKFARLLRTAGRAIRKIFTCGELFLEGPSPRRRLSTLPATNAMCSGVARTY